MKLCRDKEVIIKNTSFILKAFSRIRLWIRSLSKYEFVQSQGLVLYRYRNQYKNYECRDRSHTMQCFLMPDPFVVEIIVPADVTITCTFIHRRCFTKGYQALQLKNVHVRRSDQLFKATLERGRGNINFRSHNCQSGRFYTLLKPYSRNTAKDHANAMAVPTKTIPITGAITRTLTLKVVAL